MSDIILPNSSKTLDLDTLKSFYYWANAKPDQTVKIFKDSRKIHIEDIVSLNNNVQEKIKNHNLFSNITTVDIIFKKWKIKTFSQWEEFIRTDWNILPEVVKSISIKWDINIKLPQFELPQRHTMQVRIGSWVNASEFFQMMVSWDDDVEREESRAFAVCKVDFVNTVIANELITITETWYDCLKKGSGKWWLQKNIEEYRNIISQLSKYLISSSGLLILFILFRQSHKDEIINGFNNTIYLDLYAWILGIFVVYFVTSLIGSWVRELMHMSIYRLNEPNIFEITKGDKNSQYEIENKNNKIILKFCIWFFTTVLSVIISLILENYFS